MNENGTNNEEMYNYEALMLFSQNHHILIA